MSLRFVKGEAVGLPPVGEVVLSVDASGNAFLLLSDGTRVSVGGGLSAADQATVDYFSGTPAKVDTFQLLSKYGAGALTGFKTIEPPAYPLGGASGLTPNDGLTEGGASGSPGGNATWQGHGASYLQKTKTALWGAVWWAKFAAISGANVALMGLSNSFTIAGAERQITFGFDGAVDSTHWIFKTASGAAVTNIIADTNWHRFMITSDLTNLKLWIDMVDSGVTRPCSALTDEAMYDGARNTVGNQALVSRITFGYVQPT